MGRLKCDSNPVGPLLETGWRPGNLQIGKQNTFILKTAVKRVNRPPISGAWAFF